LGCNGRTAGDFKILPPPLMLILLSIASKMRNVFLFEDFIEMKLKDIQIIYLPKKGHFVKKM